MSHASPRDVAFFIETTFAVPPADWSASGVNIKVIEPDVTGLDIAMIENENIIPRRFAKLEMIEGLKSASTFSTAIYFTAAGATAAEASQAVATPESDVIRSALGGRRLGWSIGAQGTGAVGAPDLDADPGFTPGDWVFWYDASAGTGTYHRIESVGAGPGFAATLLNDLPALPDDANDVAHAVIMHYPDERPMNDANHANNTTLSWFVQGEDAEDRQEMSGCKPVISVDGITAGTPVKLTLEHAVTTWPETMPAKVAIPGDPSGIAPVVPGTGQATTVLMGDLGGPLSPVDCRGTIDIELNYSWSGVEGNCGTEGVKGYTADEVSAGLTLRLRFDDDYLAEFFADQRKHVLIQIGNQPGDSIGIYFPDLEYAESPDRIDEGDQTSSELIFTAHEDPADTTGIADPSDELALRRAPVVLLHTA